MLAYVKTLKRDVTHLSKSPSLCRRKSQQSVTYFKDSNIFAESNPSKARFGAAMFLRYWMIVLNSGEAEVEILQTMSWSTSKFNQ